MQLVGHNTGRNGEGRHQGNNTGNVTQVHDNIIVNKD